jgi:ABC-type sugar transport system ATPase subunit
MNHVYPIADRFTVLSQGKVAGSFDKAEKTFDELSEFIISGSVVAETD